MSHIAKEETDEATGITLKIMIDDGGTESPLEHDSAVIMAVFHRHYTNPAEGKLIPKPFGAGYWDMSNVEDAQAFRKANAHASAPYVVFPLFMYDHSGTSYRCSEGGNPFSCPWDSGRVGIIAMKKSELSKPGKHYGKGANTYVGKPYLEQAQQTCEIYTAWANGEVYGYAVENEEGDMLDSCWGFIETEGADGYVYEQGKDAMKSAIADVLQDRKIQAGWDAARAKEFGMEIPND